MNRELSTIQFQRRVLASAQDPNVPLLERAKFIAIVGNNLDEFFMVRVASYIQKVQAGITRTRPDGITPQQLLRQIREEVSDLLSDILATKKEIFELLREEKIVIHEVTALDETIRRALHDYFLAQVFPVLTPLAVDHARPFPFISNLSLNLGVFLEDPDEVDPDGYDFARIKVPIGVLPRLVNLNQVMMQYADMEIDGHHFVWVEDLIIDNLEDLFPGMNVVEAYPFRVLRNADIDYEFENEDTDEMVDVMAIIEQSVRERQFGSVVRLSVPDTISDRMLQTLREGLELTSINQIYTIEGALGSANLFQLAGVDRPDLKYPAYVPKMPAPYNADNDIFTAIRQQDILVHHPFDSFSPVEEFYRQAAEDPDVLAIKATLYRVGKNSPIVQALLDARENDKQVTVLVELKARFDEENNLGWARILEAKGVHVMYGVEELPVKTHAKITMVVRREPDGLRRYVHMGTGNYNASTARLYTDIGVFTCDSNVANDATRLFNRLTGFAPHTAYDKLLVAPDYMLNHILKLIDNEIRVAKAGGEGRIILKMNQLEEDMIIQRLYEASQAGVQVDCIVRGFCCLRPGIPNISDNIRVFSVIGRFLEHSRIYYFKNAPEPDQVLVGSADLMRRNLYNRVEVIYPLLDIRIRNRILRVLMTSLMDNVGSWELLPDGTYQRVQLQEGQAPLDSQQLFMQKSYGLEVLP